MSHRRWVSLALVSIVVISISFFVQFSQKAQSSIITWPTQGWLTATPESMGMDSVKLAKARDYAVSKGGGSGFITRNGKLVMSWGDAKTRYALKSATKSVGGATALGLALKDNKVTLDTRAQQRYPGFGVPPDTNTATGWLDDATLLNLATHTAGFEKPGGYGKMLYRPGTYRFYSDGGANWLADVLTVTYARDLKTLLFERVFSKLGITSSDLTWRNNNYRETTINGVPRREFGSGINANVDAMARIGYLYLNDGIWDGEEILQKSFIDTARVPVPSVENLPTAPEDMYSGPNAGKHYGLLFHNNADGTMPNAPRDTYFAWGLNEGLIIVIPSLNIVAARAGSGWPDVAGSLFARLAPFIEPIATSVMSNPSDSTPPVVSLTAPFAGNTVTGTIVVSANASDNIGISGVQFKLDGVNLGNEDIIAPYTISWNTLGAVNGSHTLTAVARDISNIIASSSPVSVTVDNVQPPQSIGLVAHWKFDEGTGTIAADSSGNSINGTLVNGPTWVTGKIGKALNFDGVNDVVTIPSASIFNNMGPATFSAWIKPRTLGEGGAGGRILNKAKDGTPINGWVWKLAATNRMNFKADYATTDLSRTTKSSLYALNTWSHIVLTWDGSSGASTVKMYVNGAETSSYSTTQSAAGSRVSDTTEILRIGNSRSGGNTFDGFIDDMKIFNRVLSPGEIATLYTAQ